MCAPNLKYIAIIKKKCQNLKVGQCDLDYVPFLSTCLFSTPYSLLTTSSFDGMQELGQRGRDLV